MTTKTLSYLSTALEKGITNVEITATFLLTPYVF